MIRARPKDSPGGVVGVTGMWEPDGAGGASRGRNGTGPGLRRRDRRPAVRPESGSDREGVWARHDRRHAGAGPGESTQGWAAERGVSQGSDRGDSAARCVGRRDHFQLCDQSLGRQGSRAGRSVPGAQAGRPLRGVGRGRAWFSAQRNPAQHGAVDWLRSRGAGGPGIRSKAHRSRFRRRRGRGDPDLQGRGCPGFLAGAGLDADQIAPQIEGRFMGAFIRATKPAAIETACCGSECCGGHA